MRPQISHRDLFLHLLSASPTSPHCSYGISQEVQQDLLITLTLSLFMTGQFPSHTNLRRSCQVSALPHRFPNVRRQRQQQQRNRLRTLPSHSTTPPVFRRLSLPPSYGTSKRKRRRLCLVVFVKRPRLRMLDRAPTRRQCLLVAACRRRAVKSPKGRI